MRASTCIGAVAVVLSQVAAQDPTWPSYDDLTTIRIRKPTLAQLLELRGGGVFSFADGEDPAAGQVDESGLDGHFYYHNEHFSARGAVLDAYAGRDGAYVGLADIAPGRAWQRLEATYRYSQFYREGHYQGSEFLRTGGYEGEDYGVYLGLGSMLDDGFSIEIGPYLRWHRFDDQSATALFTPPDDYFTYGARLYVEHNTLQYDRTLGLPVAGFVGGIMVEREQNDSSRTFGTPVYMSDLADGYFRGTARLDWFAPTAGSSVWEIRARGQLSDETDRVYNYEAQKPQGHMWVDLEIGHRFQAGTFTFTPYAQGQYLKLLEEDGVATQEEFFFGAGARIHWQLGDHFAFYATYSYLDNESRPSVRVDRDAYGEQMAFVGIELRLVADRY